METVFASFTSSGITVSSFLICSLVALLCGALIAFTYTRRTRFTQSLVLAVILLPFAVQTVIMLVNGNVGTGVAVAGAFGLVRFRSAPGNAKDISVIFVAMAVGLACGSGYIALSMLFTVIACAVRTTATKKDFSMRFAAATAISKCAAASRTLPWNSCKERSLPL